MSRSVGSQVLGADLARVLDRARELKEQWGDKFISAEHFLQARSLPS